MECLDEDDMSEQQYTYDGRPGCVMRHRSRATGTTIGIYKADQAGLDGSTGEWIGVCEDHGERYAFSNLRHARTHYATAPWCARCHPAGGTGVPAPLPLKPRGAPRGAHVRISGNQTIQLNMHLYERIGEPVGLRVEWDTTHHQLVIMPAAKEELKQEMVYVVQKAKRADGTVFRRGGVRALAPLRQSGLTAGRYKPKIKGDQVILKASYRIEDPADDQPDPAEAQ